MASQDFFLNINQVYLYLQLIAGFSFILFVLFAVYKSFFNHILYQRDAIGFDHIRKGPLRAFEIRHAKQTRKLGNKVPPPYPNGWYALLQSADLTSAGVHSANVLGLNLCVYRTETGQVRCVDAYCPHLGANLGVGGTVVGDCIECPFHKWRFDGSGTCVLVPGEDNPPKGVKLKSYPATEVDGAVWFWYDVDGVPPRWEIKNAPQLSEWGYRGRNEFIVNSHIQDIPENGADVAHLNAVHSPTLLWGIKAFGSHNWSASWQRNDDHTATMLLTHHYQIGKTKMLKINVVATQIGPGHVRLLISTCFGPLLISQSVVPLSPNQQMVIHRFFSPAYNAPLAAAFVYGESFMFERDMVIWNSKMYAGSPAFVKSDKTIRAFRSWFAQFYSENSIPFGEAIQAQRDTLDW